MNTQKHTHNLMEYVLTLLSLPEYNIANIGQQVSQDALTDISFFLDPENIRMAHEMIKFMDEMPGGFLIYYANDEEKILYANQALLRIFQCSTLKEFQEITGNSFKGMIYHRDLDHVEQSIKEQIAQSQYDLDYVEYRIVRKDGSIRWVEDYGHFIHSDAIGDIFYVFLGDATEKKKRHLQEKVALINEKEQILKSLIEEYDKERKIINQEHLRRLEVIEGLSVNYDSILYADLDTDRVFPYRLSSRTKRQFNKKYQALGFHWYLSNYVNTWVHPEDRERILKVTAPDYIRKKLSNSKTYYTNYRVLNNGKIQYLQLRIVNVGGEKRISQIVMGYRRVDLEIQREMEQKQILEDALKNANLAIVARNTFLSNMSHDIRTPLNAIFGFTELAKKHITDIEAVKGYLSKIEHSSKQLLELMEKVLELSWAESNKIKIDESKCNLCEILKEVHQELLGLAEEKNISLTLDDTKLIHDKIYSDPNKLKQLFQYLTHNAVTYTKAWGNVEIIADELEVLPNHHVVYEFIFKDNGIGIHKDFLAHIFEPFEREKNTTFSGIHGTGLSLTIAKNIVTTMGGTIEVDSSADKGSTFTVILNLRIPDNSANISEHSENATFQPMNHKILLVEDNMINLEIETEILQGLGFFIETAVNGSIAVEKLAHSKPGDFDLILMDIQMPVMDGREAAKAIRNLNNPLLAKIPIIALSANAFESDKQLSIESGMNAHLTKPIDIPLLLKTIEKVIKKNPA